MSLCRFVASSLRRFLLRLGLLRLDPLDHGAEALAQLDVVRAMVTVTSMDAVALVVEGLAAAEGGGAGDNACAGDNAGAGACPGAGAPVSGVHQYQAQPHLGAKGLQSRCSTQSNRSRLTPACH